MGGLNLEKIGMVCADGPDGKCVGGATWADECDSNPKMKAELFYGKCPLPGQTGGDSLGEVNNFPEYTSGDYHIVYTCTDGHGGTARTPLTSSICRTIQNVDHTLPIIQVLGSNVMTLEATHEGNYIDDGATCSDQVDGVISQNVEVNGDVVNLSRPGTYDVEYNCQDAAGNKAPTAKRIVTVKHTSCPTCYLNGCKNTYAKVSGSSHEKHSTSATRTFEGCHEKHEASFPYTDAGATCTDDIDGPLAPEMTNNVDVGNVGTYTITYRAKNSVGTWNDESCRGLSVTYVRTVEVIDTLKPVIRLKYNNKEVARGKVTDTGINHEANPAYVNGIALGHLMSEEHSSSTDAWLLAAAASAVTGLAPLGVSRRRTAVA